jgi:hypothetical protein
MLVILLHRALQREGELGDGEFGDVAGRLGHGCSYHANARRSRSCSTFGLFRMPAIALDPPL